MAAPRQCPEELRESAIRMPVDLCRDLATRMEAALCAARVISLGSTLRHCSMGLPGRGRRGPPSRRHQRIAELE